MTIEEKRRELFEESMIKILEKEHFDRHEARAVLAREDNGKYGHHLEAAWIGFEAALDAVVIELPSERRVRNGWPEGCGADMAFNDCLELCIDAIESTGLGLKVK